MNKRGQSSEGSLVIWLVVAVIAAIIVILFFSGSIGKFSGFFKAAPESLEIAVQACKQVATPETRSSYCDQWREVTIAGDTQLVNCMYKKINDQLALATPIQCTGTTTLTTNAGDVGLQYCKELFKAGKIDEKTKVNDVLCSSKTCEELGGGQMDVANKEQATACDINTENGKTKEILKGFKVGGAPISGNVQVCCVAQ